MNLNKMRMKGAAAIAVTIALTIWTGGCAQDTRTVEPTQTTAAHYQVGTLEEIKLLTTRERPVATAAISKTEPTDEETAIRRGGEPRPPAAAEPAATRKRDDAAPTGAPRPTRMATHATGPTTASPEATPEPQPTARAEEINVGETGAEEQDRACLPEDLEETSIPAWLDTIDEETRVDTLLCMSEAGQKRLYAMSPEGQGLTGPHLECVWAGARNAWTRSGEPEIARKAEQIIRAYCAAKHEVPKPQHPQSGPEFTDTQQSAMLCMVEVIGGPEEFAEWTLANQQSALVQIDEILSGQTECLSGDST